MKATFTALAALLVSTFAFNAATAQTPDPVTPAMYAGQGGYYPGGYYPGQGQYAGPVEGATAAGGCATCGKHPLLGKLGLHAAGGCKGCAGGCNGKGGALCAMFKGWLCRP